MKTFSSIKCVYCDINKTLTNDQGEVSKTTQIVFRRLVQANYLFGLTSGGHWLISQKRFHELKPNALFIGVNGGLVSDLNNQIIEQFPIATGESNHLIQYLLNQNFAFMFYTQNNLYYFVGNEHVYYEPIMSFMSRVGIVREPIEITQTFELNPNEQAVYFIVLTTISTNHYQQRIHNFLCEFKPQSELDLYRGPETIEIKSTRANKAVAIEYVAKFYHLKLDEILVIGNAHNDEALFKKVGISVAMQQANDALKTCADYVTEFTNNADGAARFIAKHLLSKTSSC